MIDDQNPYRAPTSALTNTVNLRTAELAGKGRRFGTLLLDYVCYILCAAVLGAFVGLAFGEEGVAAMDRIPDILLGVIVMLTYYVFFEGIWSRTPGKFILGTIVVTDEGGKPGLGQIFKRTACRFIPFEAFSFFGSTGWHDSISHTRVVRTR